MNTQRHPPIHHCTSLGTGFLIWLLLILLVLSASAAAAMNGASLDWTVLASGGANSTAGNVILESTLGQPIAGSPASGSLALCSGYWCEQLPLQVYLPMLQHSSVADAQASDGL